MNALQKNVLEEIKDLIIEGEFQARDILIQTYFKVGQLIIENNLETQHVASYLNKSVRTIEYIVKFSKEPKILDKLEKHESWHSIVKNRLTTHKELQEHTHTPITVCSSCKKKLD